MIDRTHDPELRSWVESANQPGSDFPIQNLPFATFRSGAGPHAGVAIGDRVLDVTEALRIPSLEALMSMPKAARVDLRQQISNLLVKRTTGIDACMLPMSEVELLLPCAIGDYSDFYASIHHATNVGSMFRPDNPLLPNYKWLPVGYHGRASSMVVSGTAVRRPWGQSVRASRRSAVVRAHAPARLRTRARRLPRPRQCAERTHSRGRRRATTFSASACSTTGRRAIYRHGNISRWGRFFPRVSPLRSRRGWSPWRRSSRSAARPNRGRHGDPQPLPHLRTGTGDAYDITLEVWLRSARMAGPVRVSRSHFASLYWTLAQMVAHHASNGCPLRAGRPDRQRHGLRSGQGKSRLPAGIDLARQRAVGASHRRNPEIPGGWRRSDPARLVRSPGVPPHRPGRMPRKSSAGRPGNVKREGFSGV